MKSLKSPSASSPAIGDAINRLRQLSTQDVQASWRWYAGEAPCLSMPPAAAAQGWQPVTLNPRHHVAWPKGRTVLWLQQSFCWPAQRHQYPLDGLAIKLALRWWADLAEIFVDGRLVQTGDLFDCFTRISLGESLVPGQTVTVSLKLISPNHDEGALVNSCLEFEAPDGQLSDLNGLPEPSFIANEMDVLERYLRQFAPHQLPRLEAALGALTWDSLPKRRQFHQALGQLRHSLASLSPWVKQRSIHCLGHAHLDLAWLWPLTDTWQAAERTFKSVLQLQQDFPELTYTHSSPALFAWLEVNRPDLFAAVQEAVQQGAWAIDAGLWVEPELNLISGESILRQLLYGQRYCQEKFGRISQVAWLPDSFGFCWQLPQLLRLGGVRYFATQKLRWNDTNPFPHDWFRWQGPDGSTIFSLTLPPIGTDLDPVAMAAYAIAWEANTQQLACLWLPGVGDHGGGPTRDMLQRARRWAESPFFPRLVFDHVEPFLHRLAQRTDGLAMDGPSTSSAPEAAPARPPLPIWQDELYLELHRGCYTTHAEQKQYNRQGEDGLYQAELWSTLAWLGRGWPYPQKPLEEAWKQVLFNQFHDILPGSAIPEVFTDANQTWKTALDTAHQLCQEALTALSTTLELPPPPQANATGILLFNSLNWQRSEVVALELPPASPEQPGWQLRDSAGRALPQQLSRSANPVAADGSALTSDSDSLLVLAAAVPSVGCRLVWLCPTETVEATDQPPPDAWVLENQHLQVTIDETTGDIASLWDKAAQRQVLSAPGNQLQAFHDPYQYWDAWNIAPDYQQHPLPPCQLTAIHWLDYGPVRQRLRVVRQLNQSTFIQDYGLDAGAPCLTIDTMAHWQETHILIKAAFPTTLQAAQASYEIPFGAIDRPTQAQTPEAAAKWEVPALRWADLSQADYGFSVLTRGKHGFSASPHQLSLTLLKAPTWPDPQADRGWHRFTYALYPHAGPWTEAQTVRLAYNLNQPLVPHQLGASPTPAEPISPGTPPSGWALENDRHSFLSLGDNSLVLAALKLPEDHSTPASTPAHCLVRWYESQGKSSCVHLGGTCAGDLLYPVDGLELPLPHAEPAGAGVSHPQVHPWQVMTYAMAVQSPPPPVLSVPM